MRSQSFPLEESQSKGSQAGRSQPLNEHDARIETENRQLRKQLADYETAYSSSQKKLAELKAHRAQLHKRLEEATATIFRLRPQRQEHTESEIQKCFYRLSESIKNWIEKNCDGFLEDNDHGFEIMLNCSINGNSGMGSILKRFQWKAQDLTDVKEHVLAAILMRYLFDEILNRPLSILLKEEEEGLLNGIYENMATMEHPKGKISHFSCVSGSANDMPILRFADEAHLENADTTSSIEKEIVVPAIALSQKIQSASSIWEFKYSEWCDCEPEKPMATMPNFRAIIEDYQCTNLSARGKQLKTATDLATPDQQQSLVYMLDIFPGLYCQRMTPAGFQPRTTVNKPVLIVSFDSGVSQQHTDPLDPIMRVDRETSVPLPNTVQTHRSTDGDRRVMKDGQAPARTAPHSLDAEDADHRTASSSRRVEGASTRSQSSRHHQEAMNSSGGARGRSQEQPRHPAPKDEGFIGGLLKQVGIR
ncbi:hypothetical protein V500_07320 [Pseudogymnoascus sp. VKM F-4518 (FW-2643)]|nr:hypothetical protein V500_07320 [Pseudogymnoascus sp. VKM F-4518 (FW-2643)]